MTEQINNPTSEHSYPPLRKPRSTTPPSPPLWQRILKHSLWQGKIGPAFWTITGSISLMVNLVLLVILIVFGRELFALKDLLNDQLIGGLYSNFVKMDQSVIETEVIVNDIIVVQDTIPIEFTLPVETDTVVLLSEDIDIEGATVSITTPVFTLVNAPTDITLPKGTGLAASLDISVPVNTEIPVTLSVPVLITVPVSIPMNQTQLHEPFTGLQEVLAPYDKLLGEAPNSWEEAFCTTEEDQLICTLIKKAGP